MLSTLCISLLIFQSRLPPTHALPPNIPSASVAKGLLDSLTVAEWASEGDYARSKYGGWKTVHGACNTRETVLMRDGTDVVTNPKTCAAVSGVWNSPYEGGTWTAASDLDVDHMVPLSHSWKCGASYWTAAQRLAFANDLKNPQLIAVTDNINQAKGDAAPDEWKPPLKSFWCMYVRMWIKVKSVYGLTITATEKKTLVSMLGTCKSSAGDL
ncbi:MAG: hypothetical protein M1839_001424 [Geoglossum umbratile]|nr:MAG: hypothetical protein M1839_001424 [Geoglossum umbratile]